MGRRPNDEKIEVVNIRMVKEPSLYSAEKIRSPEDAIRVIADELATYDREVFAILNLKTNGQPINLNICSMGTLDAEGTPCTWKISALPLSDMYSISGLPEDACYVGVRVTVA